MSDYYFGALGVREFCTPSGASGGSSAYSSTVSPADRLQCGGCPSTSAALHLVRDGSTLDIKGSRCYVGGQVQLCSGCVARVKPPAPTSSSARVERPAPATLRYSDVPARLERAREAEESARKAEKRAREAEAALADERRRAREAEARADERRRAREAEAALASVPCCASCARRGMRVLATCRNNATGELLCPACEQKLLWGAWR